MKNPSLVVCNNIYSAIFTTKCYVLIKPVITFLIIEYIDGLKKFNSRHWFGWHQLHKLFLTQSQSKTAEYTEHQFSSISISKHVLV